MEGAVDIEMMQRMLLIQSEEAAFDSAAKEGEDKIREFDDQVRRIPPQSAHPLAPMHV
jgi:hypothetical protein